MPKIVPLVEGDGEVSAVPLLLRETLAQLGRWDFEIARPRNAHGCGNLTKENGLERFVRLCLKEPECAAIVILMDADKNCPATLAREFSQRVNALNIPVPVVTILTNREYENWFLASVATIAGKDLNGRPGLAAGCEPPDEPESVANPKRWLTERMPSGRAYKETEDQAPMTKWLDHDSVAAACRSFRRLRNAVLELVQSVDAGAARVTP